jgi:dihydroxyacetone kinase
MAGEIVVKKLINNPATVVEEMVDGLVAVYPSLRRLEGHTVLVRAENVDPTSRRVAVISGGGSGHEPAHAGYVGRGMLSAAVAGDVFTSPNPEAVLAAIRATAGPAGALLVIKNYTGDRLNFGLAAELARAEGIPVENVLVADDVALAISAANAGRRGLAGTILVHKIAGAVAESGATLPEVAAAARAAAGAVRTMGLALTSCTVPAAGRPGFTLGETEIELGLGIHGEPGVRRGSVEPADVLVDALLDAILADLAVVRDARVVLMINNLGATPPMELAVVARRAVAVLERRGVLLERVYMGTFLSALDMAGVSLSMLPVNDERLAQLDAPTGAIAWPNAASHPRLPTRLPTEALPASNRPVHSRASSRPHTLVGLALESAILTATQALIEAAPRLTDMDRVVGDGDLGISLERGSQAVQQELPGYPIDDPAAAVRALAVTLQRFLGGTSGPLYAAFFLRASTSLGRGAATEARTWATAFQAGCEAIAELGGATAGDRTMLDALLPAAAAFQAAVNSHRSRAEALRSAAEAAARGVRATEQMVGRRGRSSYLGERVLGCPDPGAEAVAIILDALARI